jgi:hypothetical protein
MARLYEMYAGFEVVTAVVVKSSIFWDIMHCSRLKFNRRFRRNITAPFLGSKDKPSENPA